MRRAQKDQKRHKDEAKKQIEYQIGLMFQRFHAAKLIHLCDTRKYSGAHSLTYLCRLLTLPWSGTAYCRISHKEQTEKTNKQLEELETKLQRSTVNNKELKETIGALQVQIDSQPQTSCCQRGSSGPSCFSLYTPC